MNRFFAFVLMLAQGCVAYAANPSFQSFRGTQFDTRQNIVGITNGAIITNLYGIDSITVDDGSANGGLFTSLVADGATAVGFSLNSSNALSNTKARLLSVENQGTNILSIGRGGGVYIGPGTYDDYSGNTSQIGFVAESFDANGGVSPKNVMQWGNLAYDWYANITHSFSGTTNSNVKITFSGQNQDGDGFAIESSSALLSWQMFDDNGVGFAFIPTKADGVTPYVQDTTIPHSSGNLLEVKNNGTNMFVVPFDGVALMPGITVTNITVENNVIVKGNIKSDTLIVTNNVNFFNNTYVSNIYAFNGVFTNSLELKSGVNITGGNLTNTGTYVGTINGDTSGTILKQTKFLQLQGPNYGDGVGAVPQTNNYTVSGLMHYTFSGTAAASANYVRYEIAVPEDLDTAGTIKIARFKFSTAGTSTSQINWQAQLGTSAVSGQRTPSFGTAVTFNVTPSSAAANDIFEAAGVTLTGWAAALTPGAWWVIEIARDGTDSNNDAMTDAILVLSYTAKSQ